MKPASRIELPAARDLVRFLELDERLELQDLFSRCLCEPLTPLLTRPRKNLRARLLTWGHAVAAQRLKVPPAPPELLERGAQILEAFHAGSLIIDDIEDGSLTRRGAPSLHHLVGIPVALNAGNWLYFLPFQWIDEMDLPEERKFRLARECQKTLLQAHYGQALDVGVPFDSVSPERLPAVVGIAAELKTGALCGLALKIGAILAGGDGIVVTALEKFGRRYGIALQMFDDIGNFLSDREPEKVAEDFKLKRLNFIVSVAADTLTPEAFEGFLRQSARLPDGLTELRALLAESGIVRAAKDRARKYQREALDELNAALDLDKAESDAILSLQEQLEKAYG